MLRCYIAYLKFLALYVLIWTREGSNNWDSKVRKNKGQTYDVVSYITYKK